MARSDKTLLIAGIAEGFGLSLSSIFAEAGFNIVGLSRSTSVAKAAETLVQAAGRRYRHIVCDLTDAQGVKTVLAPFANEIDAAIVTAHELRIAPFLETAPEDFIRLFALNCGGAVHVAQGLLPGMITRGAGTLILCGATASQRGGGRFSAFAASKFALRGLSQSLAREFGPAGIHVAHLVIDGLIESPQTTRRFPGASGGKIDPDALARTCLVICCQPPGAFTQELDIRPHTERF